MLVSAVYRFRTLSHLFLLSNVQRNCLQLLDQCQYRQFRLWLFEFSLENKYVYSLGWYNSYWLAIFEILNFPCICTRCVPDALLCQYLRAFLDRESRAFQVYIKSALYSPVLISFLIFCTFLLAFKNFDAVLSMAEEEPTLSKEVIVLPRFISVPIFLCVLFRIEITKYF